MVSRREGRATARGPLSGGAVGRTAAAGAAHPGHEPGADDRARHRGEERAAQEEPRVAGEADARPPPQQSRDPPRVETVRERGSQ